MINLVPEIRSQIEAIDLQEGRPLILCDADEVLFKFLDGLEHYLESEGYWLDMTSFRLTGNVKEQGSNEVVDGLRVKELLDSFFKHRTEHLEPVEGAAEALESLSDHAQIVILSNLPLAQRLDREKALAEHGMPYPLVANQGIKGPPAKALADAARGSVTFLDDLPPNLQSVREAVPHATLIHFIADPRLAQLIGKAEASDLRLDTWPEVHELLSRQLRQT
ncbi:MAG: hypothetical protein EP340_10595 [Alphaproteobacteria bacterium]|nr:MAG: hypothetical protein EP340_10595 [Alphaproteobacteria bacterium]